MVTKTAFVYFSNKWKAYNASDKPLMAIALTDIASVQRVTVNIPEIFYQQQKVGKSSAAVVKFPQYQLEVFLKEGASIVNDDEDEKEVPEADIGEERTPVNRPPDIQRESEKPATVGGKSEGLGGSPKAESPVPPKIGIISPCGDQDDEDEDSEAKSKEEDSDSQMEHLHINSEMLDMSRPQPGDQDVPSHMPLIPIGSPHALANESSQS